MDTPQTETVINISSKELSADQTSLLSKGLSFVPTSGINAFGLKVDLFKCFRQIKLKHFFSKNDTVSTPTTTQTPTFKPKSLFCPNSMNASINTFCRLVEQDIFNNVEKPMKVKNNLPENERKALMELINDNDLVIKPSDKGGGICVQDTDKYEAEIVSQLSNKKFYKRLKSDPTNAFQKEVRTYLERARENNWITKAEFDFLYCQHPIRPVFYTLPKVHKSLTNPPGRPIIAQIDSLLAPLSEFVDSYIKPYVHTLPAYIKDTTDFINKISTVTDLSDEVFLVTLDIASLYTNIPHESGLEALDFYLKDRESGATPPSEFLIDLAAFVMRKNYFMFNGDFYLQVSGTSMGSICAPNYANLFVGFFERNFVMNMEKNTHLPRVSKWFRFIDDIFTLYHGTEEELLEFINLLNSFNENLEFTVDYSKERVHFLDMWVEKNNGSLSTTLYRKETDKNTLLLASSFHPTPLKRGLPKSQFFRLRRICETTEDYIDKANDMKDRFLQRGYPIHWVEKAYNTALNKSRAALLKKSKKTEKKFSVTCVTSFSPLSHTIRPIFKKYWPILKSDPELAHLMTDMPLFVYKREKNLRDLLVHADFTRYRPRRTSQRLLSPLPTGNYRCGGCAQCNNTFKTRTFRHPHNNKSFPIKSVITCASTHVVYTLTCPCGLVYVGKTTRQLKQRVSEHKSTIRRNDRNYPVAVHFNDCKHDISQLRYCGIEQVAAPRRGGNHDLLLKRREAYWIFTLQTLAPKGLNDEFNLNVMLG